MAAMLPPRSQSQHVFHLLTAWKTNSRQAFTFSLRSSQWGKANSSEAGVRSTPIGRDQAGIETETVRSSVAPMEQPLLLAAADGPGGSIRLSPRGLEALRALPAPLHVVAALGPPDGGSVFLMEQLSGSGCGKGVEAGRRGEGTLKGVGGDLTPPSPPHPLRCPTGFPGSPGLWMWRCPHPEWPDRELLLLHAGGFLGGEEPEVTGGVRGGAAPIRRPTERPPIPAPNSSPLAGWRRAAALHAAAAAGQRAGLWQW